MLFPLFVDLTEKNILVVGGGSIATRRIHTLMEFAEHITVIAPEVTEQVKTFAQEGRICMELRPFADEDLQKRDMVLAATDNLELNEHIYQLCKEQGILVNSCSDQKACDFQFPSIILNEELVVGINSSGRNHKKVKEARERLEEALSTTNSLYK